MIAVIADDFTGAAEIGGVGLKYGLKVVVETQVKDAGEADLLIIAVDTRSLSAEKASLEIENITKKLLKLNPDFLFKKLDSVLRGNIAVEINSQLKTIRKNRALIVAGNPSFGRLIVNGKYTVKNIPLVETSFANDPDFPIKSSMVTCIVGEDEMPVYSVSVNEEIPDEGIIVGDVSNQKELEKWAEKIDDETLVAGGAGFFDVLIRKRFGYNKLKGNDGLILGSKTLFVFGSKFPKSRKLPMGLSGHETVKINMPDEIYAGEDFAPEVMERWADQVVNILNADKKVIITIEQDYSEEVNLSARIRKNIGELIKEISIKTEIADLLIEGGATTSEILKALNISRLYPTRLVHQGIIQMKVQDYPDLTITTKPGSYLWPESVKFEKETIL